MERVNPEAGKYTLSQLKALEGRRDRIQKYVRDYYNLFDFHQKMRFRRLVREWGKKLGFYRHKGRHFDDIEIILLKQIALNTIRIEETEFLVRSGQVPRFGTEDTYSLACQKERRETIKLLHTLIHTKRKKKSVTSFDDVRNVLRKDKGLEETETQLEPDKYDRARRPDVGITLRVAGGKKEE